MYYFGHSESKSTFGVKCKKNSTIELERFSLFYPLGVHSQ